MFAAPSKMPQQYPRSGLFPPIFDQDGQSGSDDDVTLNGLKEIVSRQQKEIENHQQQLVAKEQRLKFLKSPNIMENNDEAVRMMRDKAQVQEQKLERLREIQGQVDQQKLSNVSELDNVKALFEDKERELASAVARVDSLSKQLDTLKKSQVTKFKGDNISISADELEKLKQDLKLKSEINEQKNRELAMQLDILNKRNKHVDYLDQRIEELQMRLKKKRAAMEQNPIILGPHRNKNPNIATVEPSVRQEPVIQKDEELKKEPIFPSSQDSRYQTLPLGFKFTPSASTVGQSNAYDGNKEHEQVSGPIEMKPRSSPDLHNQVQRAPIKSEASIGPRPIQSGPIYPTLKYGQQPNYPSHEPDQTPSLRQQQPAHPPNSRPHVPLSVYSSDSNNNRRNSPDYTKDKPDGQPTSRPNMSSAPVVAPYKPMYASRSVIADTYMKRLGPRPMYAATKPHSIPNFHPQNSIISDKVSSKNNTLRSLRRRHSYTETDEAKIEQALGPREVTPGAAETSCSPTSAEPPEATEPEPEVTEPETEPDPVPEPENTSWDEPNRVPNSGIVARQILKKELGVKRNLTRRVCFDPHALLLDASLEGEYDLVKRSASEVKNPSQPNDEGITALHNAICAGHLDIVKFLVKFGVDINSQDVDGWTPLHCSASCNNLAMTKLLVEHGACIYATTFSDQETPAEKCEEDDDGYDGCYQYLYGIQEKLGVLNQGAVYALYDYQPARDDELSLRNGEKMTVVRKHDDDETEWWWARLADKEGFIPRTFIGLFPRVITPV